MNILKRSPLKDEHHRKNLTYLSMEGCQRTFMENMFLKKQSHAINHELKFIEQMNYAAYFLTVYDIVRFAREQEILCQGRGSAANSPFVIALVSLLLILPNLICCLNGLFLLPAMNHRILMWTLNMNAGKK